MGCPAGIGPEVTLSAAFSGSTPPAVIVGDRNVLLRAAEALRMSAQQINKLRDFDESERHFSGVRLVSVSRLTALQSKWGRPTKAAGVAQLDYIEQAYSIAQRCKLPLVTGPVSKAAIAHSGLRRATGFRGHTEWLEQLDGAAHSVMCFASSRLVTSLVTTHVPIKKVPRILSAELVARATLELVDLLLRLGVRNPRVAVSSLNPHAGEESLLGGEEKTAIFPGITLARQIAGRRARISGPVGAETAYRKAASRNFDGVVAMYHDQATIPMKLLDFGGAVNVTQGLSIVRTSVDHGTAYDIAGSGQADARGMCEAMNLAGLLGATSRKIAHSSW
jgi:4-hydroxythreonine-4-phosphate dehydrogenase